MFPYLISNSGAITVVVDNKNHTVEKSNPLYNKLLDSIRNNDEAAVRKYVDVRKAVEDYVGDKFKIVDSKVYYRDTVLDNGMTKRLLAMLRDGYPVEPLIKFMEKLLSNPSATAVNELYMFLDYGELPITENGNFLAYKKITGDYKDYYTKKIDNSVGTTVKMERNLVDDDRNKTCSFGLHICSLEYLNHFSGERVVVVEVNPRDVVSIPIDYNNTKCRVCEYTVAYEIDKDKADKAFSDKLVAETRIKEDALIAEHERKLKLAAAKAADEAEKLAKAQNVILESSADVGDGVQPDTGGDIV